MLKARDPNTLLIDTAPNRLTLLRILAVPGVVYFLRTDDFWQNVIATTIFSLAAITDFFDGYIARAYKSVTIVGKLMDPLADKFLVVTSLIMLQQLGRINPYVVMVLICREMAITSLRALASAEGVVIAAGTGGKWKAAMQMVAIPFLILHVELFGFFPCELVGQILIGISLALSLSSAMSYVVDFFRSLREKA